MLKHSLEDLKKQSSKLQTNINKLEYIISTHDIGTELFDWQIADITEQIVTLSKDIYNLNNKKNALLNNLPISRENKEEIQTSGYNDLITILSSNQEECSFLIKKQMFHRRYMMECHFDYEGELFDKLKDCEYIEGKTFIIYQHIYPPNERTYDNDNYSITESKRILDIVVDANIISSDKGENVGIMHLTNIKENIAEPETVIHVVSYRKIATYLDMLLKNG